MYLAPFTEGETYCSNQLWHCTWSVLDVFRDFCYCSSLHFIPLPSSHVSLCTILSIIQCNMNYCTVLTIYCNNYYDSAFDAFFGTLQSPTKQTQVIHVQKSGCIYCQLLYYMRWMPHILNNINFLYFFLFFCWTVCAVIKKCIKIHKICENV